MAGLVRKTMVHRLWCASGPRVGAGDLDHTDGEHAEVDLRVRVSVPVNGAYGIRKHYRGRGVGHRKLKATF